MANITVIGAGGWGTALAITFSEKNNVVLWTRFKDHENSLKLKHENIDYLPGVKIPENIIITSDLDYALKNSDIVVFVVPSKYFRDVAAETVKKIKSTKCIVSASKGFDPLRKERLSILLKELFHNKFPIVVLSGPSHAEEVARKVPTSVVVASEDEKAAIYAQENLSTKIFRIYRVNDVIGVELGGALKNIIAIAAGIAHGMGLGDNTLAALITRGLAEIRRFGLAYNADFNTFSGLSGVGDLIVTCLSEHSRNHRVGYMLGKGQTLHQIVDHMKMVAEGVDNVKIVVELSKMKGIEMPITQAVYNVIFNNAKPADELHALLERSLKHEIW